MSFPQDLTNAECCVTENGVILWADPSACKVWVTDYLDDGVNKLYDYNPMAYQSVDDVFRAFLDANGWTEIKESDNGCK
jgi:hypothetical protein